MDKGRLRKALAAKDEATVLAVMSWGITAFQKNLAPNFARLISDVRNATGTEAAKRLAAQLKSRQAMRAAYNDDQARDKDGKWTAGYHVIEHKDDGSIVHHGVYQTKTEAHKVGGALRKSGHPGTYVHHSTTLTHVYVVKSERHAARIGFAFDKTNPKAKAWVEQHAADTIEGISETTRTEIKELVEKSFDQEFDVDELASQIADLIGDDDRAEVIARTETMRASNEGQQEAWDQAVEDGLLTGTEQQEWIVTPDDRLCPVCEPLDGVTTDLDGTFEVDGDEIDGPPAHPRCRCTVGLKLGS